MKIIHCADIHLGSVLTSLPKELADSRKAEVRVSFAKMADYARDNGISVILLSGDVFDKPTPASKDLNFFYDIVEKHPDIDFLYLRGNHDLKKEPENYPNLKVFSEKWNSYEYGDVTVSGIELCEGNSDSCYSTLTLDKSKKNIVMLHGQVGSEINLTKLRDKYIDYLALGHVHSFGDGEIDRRGKYAYCGCLEGRGFDETGEKGFVILDTDGVGISYEFHPFSQRVIEEHRVDISGTDSVYDVCKKVKDTVNLKENGIYRIVLTGETESDCSGIENDVKTFLASYCGHVSVKNGTTVRILYEDYINDLSLRGELVRLVQSSDRTEEEKSIIVRYILKALSGEKPE